MGNIALAIEQVVKKVLANLDVLVVNRIRSNARHDLVIENGSGAYVKLVGDNVLISGYGGSGDATFDRIYLGADHLCWIGRDLFSGDMVLHVKPGNGLLFEDVHYTTIPSAQTTYIAQANSGTNYSTSATLEVSTGPDCEAYIAFDVSLLTLPVTLCKLRLYSVNIANVGASYLTISRTLETFDPTTVTWDDQPAYLTRSGDTNFYMMNAGDTTWMEFDVTTIINDNVGGTFGINVKRSSGQNMQFSSAAGANPPQLYFSE